MRLGIVQSMFKDVPPAALSAVKGPFREVFKQQTGIPGELEVFADWAALSDKIKDGYLSCGVLHGFEFAWAKKANPDLQPIVVSNPHESKLSGCIVVNGADLAAVTKPAELTGPSVVVPKGLKAHAHLFYEALRKEYPANVMQPVAGYKGNTEDAITAVLQGEEKAALVDYAAVKNYQALHPGYGKNIKVLCESVPFPVTVLMVKKGVVNEAMLTKIQDGLTQANKTSEGKMMMMLWGLKGFGRVPKDYDDQLDRISKAYPPPVTRPVPLTTSNK